MKRIQNSCLCCKNKLSGRADKKYCNAHCKSAHHYVKAQELAPNFFNKVDNQLKLNRRILKQFNKAIMAKVG
ncbi:MAG: ribulose kinase [Flavobacteriales bacterium]|jgi:ribulose kinase|tara:strand:+ start:1352 stop:1567 length:216 start_codon:yes stop_codon:yes gene_type:complete